MFEPGTIIATLLTIAMLAPLVMELR